MKTPPLLIQHGSLLLQDKPAPVPTDILLKGIPVYKETHKVEVSAEFFNLTNASNFTTTNTALGAATFGAKNVPGAPFQMQLGVRYKF